MSHIKSQALVNLLVAITVVSLQSNKEFIHQILEMDAYQKNLTRTLNLENNTCNILENTDLLNIQVIPHSSVNLTPDEGYNKTPMK